MGWCLWRQRAQSLLDIHVILLNPKREKHTNLPGWVENMYERAQGVSAARAGAEDP